MSRERQDVTAPDGERVKVTTTLDAATLRELDAMIEPTMPNRSAVLTRLVSEESARRRRRAK